MILQKIFMSMRSYFVKISKFNSNTRETSLSWTVGIPVIIVNMIALNDTYSMEGTVGHAYHDHKLGKSLIWSKKNYILIFPSFLAINIHSKIYMYITELNMTNF